MNTQLGNYIRLARIYKGFSLRKLAKLLCEHGVAGSYSYLSEIETGKRGNISLIFAYRLCKLLKLNLNDMAEYAIIDKG